MSTERIEATADDPLPNGGAYAIVTYRDADGTPVPKAEAVKAEVIEYSRADRPITITLLDIEGESDAAND